MVTTDGGRAAPAQGPAVGRPARSARLTQVGLGLGVALAILAGAWLVSGRAGWETIGRGGGNQRLVPEVGGGRGAEGRWGRGRGGGPLARRGRRWGGRPDRPGGRKSGGGWGWRWRSWPGRGW